MPSYCMKVSLLVLVLLVFALCMPGYVRASSVYNWTKTFSGTNTYEFGGALAHDSRGNVYVSGCFQGTNIDFDPSESATDVHSAAGGCDIFLTKYSATDEYLWTKTLGSAGDQQGLVITVDGDDNIILSGHTEGTVDFDFTAGVQNYTSPGNDDAFVCKYTYDMELLWCGIWGGNGGHEYAADIELDADGNLYLGGLFRSQNVDFDPGAGTVLRSPTSVGKYDAYLLKLDSGGIFQWVKTWGGTTDDKVVGVYLNSGNDVYATGYFEGSNVDFDASSGTDLHSSNGGRDIFVSKLDQDGNYQWTRTWG